MPDTNFPINEGWCKTDIKSSNGTTLSEDQMKALLNGFAADSGKTSRYEFGGYQPLKSGGRIYMREIKTSPYLDQPAA